MLGIVFPFKGLQGTFCGLHSFSEVLKLLTTCGPSYGNPLIRDLGFSGLPAVGWAVPVLRNRVGKPGQGAKPGFRGPTPCPLQTLKFHIRASTVSFLTRDSYPGISPIDNSSGPAWKGPTSLNSHCPPRKTPILQIRKLRARGAKNAARNHIADCHTAAFPKFPDMCMLFAVRGCFEWHIVFPP